MMVSVRRFAGIVAALAMSAVVMVGCDDGKKDPVGPGTGGGNIANAANEAWTLCVDGAGCTGYVFKADKSAFTVVQLPASTDWIFVEFGTWATSGDTVTVTFGGVPVLTAAYSVKGSSLELTVEGSPVAVTYTKKSGVTQGGGGEECVGDDCEDPGEIGYDPKLITEEGQAWVNDDGFFSIAVVFKAGGSGTSYYNVLGFWLGEDMDGWYTIGNKLYVIVTEEDEDGVMVTDTSISTYTVSGNTLTLIDEEEGETIVFTKKELTIGGGGDSGLENTMWMDMESGAMWSFLSFFGMPIAQYVDDENDVHELYMWSVSGDKLTLTPMDDEEFEPTGEPDKVLTFSIDGGTLTLDGVEYASVSGMEDMFKKKLPKAPKLPKRSQLLAGK
ncbi:MAG: hypothetical protein FWB85_06345 [Chitinispirillia bacterium]|nr:hypothetical protein [Chitinispirillia bacterium]